MTKIKKGIPLIDQHDKNGFWGQFGGNFIPETLKKPVEDLTILFKKLRRDITNKTANILDLLKLKKIISIYIYYINFRMKITN